MGDQKDPKGIDQILEGHATTDVPQGECQLDPPTDPCVIVILGASGDLTSRKLIPSLYSLYLKGGLPDRFSVVGCARTDMNSGEFRYKAKEGANKSGLDLSRWTYFEKKIQYQVLGYDDPASYRALAAMLEEVDGSEGTDGNRLFYLALPPALYTTVARQLADAGLGSQEKGWSRIVIEKPYGTDRASAADLDAVVHRGFTEEQTFRIDHYLAKETVQSILMFRFANAIFEPVWNRNFIEHVDIIAAETLGVEKRAGYYDSTGVLRDMFQNHMLQLLALTAMEPPNHFEAGPVRDEKIKLFKTLRPFPVDNLFENIVLGQYGPGTVDGSEVSAYRDEEGVAGDSLTPTYAMMRVFIDNWRWQGVPFFITSGKRLGAKLTEIVIKFKEVPVSMFRGLLGEPISANVLTIGIQPREHITLTFQTKAPGAKVCLRTVTMDFDYQQGITGPALDAYEKALLDCMNGEQMLFWRQDGVQLAWRFMEPVLEACETCEDRDARLQIYEPGSWGPEGAAELKSLMVGQCR
jgi:glucose-6-phosphate 1-dehydrogenase